MRKSISAKEYKILDTGVFLFMVFPFLFLLYCYLVARGDMIEFISKTPRVTISFIGAMIVPFVGIGLKNIKKMMVKEYLNLAFISLCLLLLSQIFFFNIIGIIVLGFLSFKIYRINGIEIKGIWKYIKEDQGFFILNCAILLISLMCFMLSYKL